MLNFKDLEMTMKCGSKEWLVFIISILFLTDLTILLNTPFLRQILGFLFLIILPGLLILQILKLDKIGSTEKIILTVGLSISFLMFFGLMINSLSLSLGYKTPLSTISLLISFNIAFIALAVLGYKINKNLDFSFLIFNLSTSEKAFLIVPILFPALSIFGMHVMNTTGNNIILLFLLLLIPAYVVFVCFFNQKFTKRLYPAVIFSTSISLLLIFMLRFPHICGNDVHVEYYLFQTTLDNLHWGALIYGNQLDACLSISLLPAIFQSILNINAQEYLFKGIYVLICSFSPLAIYVISKRYIGELYAFLASFFFMSQSTFLVTAGSPRTNLAIYFVALAVMVFFNDKIDPLKRRFLFIVFMLSIAVSHYSTTYVFFFVILFSWFAIEILSRVYTFKKSITLTIVLFFFAFIFFWYSQVTETAFNAGVGFVEKTFMNLHEFFIEESRNPALEGLYGQGLQYGIISKVDLAVTWGVFTLIGIGVLTMLKRYKEMVSISNIKHKKPDFLKTKFEMEYLVMALACSGLLVIMVALPFVSVGYGIQRLYSLVIIILSVCFVMGGMTLSRFFFFYKKRKPVLKEKNNVLQVRAYLVILLILIPYFLFVTGVMHQIFGASDSLIFSSEGERLDRRYIHDSEIRAAKWLMMNGEKEPRVYTTDGHGRHRVISQGRISPSRVDSYSFSKHRNIEGYIYLCYNNVVKGKLVAGTGNMSEYSDMFVGKSKVYSSGCAEIYR